MTKAADVKELLAALRTQGWQVTLTDGGNKYKAHPPDKGKKMVVFSALPSGADAFTAITRELRHSGFVWPPPEKRKATVVPIHSATPFAAKPHPEVETVDEEDDENRPAPRDLGAPIAPPVQAARPKAKATGRGSGDEDVMYLELKEAKALVDLAGEELRAAKDKLDIAQATYDTAKQEYESALSDLRKRKKAFDAAFEEKERA